MLVEAIVFSLIIGKLRGYKIFNLEKTTMKKWWFIIISVSIELTTSLIIKNNIKPFDSIIVNNYLIIHLFVYIFLFIFILFNLSYKSFYIIFAGSLLNFIVIMANKGFMPVNTEMAISMGFTRGIELLKAGKVAGHAVLIKGETNLWLLGDIINIPPPYPFPQSISIGDVLLSLGVFLFIQNRME